MTTYANIYCAPDFSSVNPFCKLKRSQARGRETQREGEVGGVERMRVSERERERSSERKESERQRGRKREQARKCIP